MRDGAVAGFKFFECSDISRVNIITRGGSGFFEICLSYDAEPIGKINITGSNAWKTYGADIKIPDGDNALYFRYIGGTPVNFLSFELL
jgi:hypothetical protein